MRKIRPRDPETSDLAEPDGEAALDGLGAGARLAGDASAGIAFDDFLRGANPLSVAAGVGLEIDAEIRFHNLDVLAALHVAEYQVVLHGMIDRSRQIKIHRLVVGTFH